MFVKRLEGNKDNSMETMRGKIAALGLPALKKKKKKVRLMVLWAH